MAAAHQCVFLRVIWTTVKHLMPKLSGNNMYHANCPKRRNANGEKRPSSSPAISRVFYWKSLECVFFYGWHTCQLSADGSSLFEVKIFMSFCKCFTVHLFLSEMISFSKIPKYVIKNFKISTWCQMFSRKLTVNVTISKLLTA